MYVLIFVLNTCTHVCTVMQMTGRRGRLIRQSDGTVKYQLRSQNEVPLEMLNLAEKQAFMDGEKVCASVL